MNKICGDCGRELSTEFFEIIKRTNKYYTYCKECHRKQSKEYYLKTRESRKKINREQRRLWKINNHARTLELKKKSYDKLSELPYYKYDRYKRGAKRYNRVFNISFDFFESIVLQNCHYCGTSERIGVDRKDNNIGYLEENCLPCCTTCNIRKKQMTYEKFINRRHKKQ